jgi:hypothetical protein
MTMLTAKVNASQGVETQGEANADPTQVLSSLQPQSLLQREDIKALRSFNQDLLAQDFEDYSALPDEESHTDPGRVELEDVKIYIFGTTLAKMATICIEQLTLIFLVRALTSQSDYNHYMGAIMRTLTERTWAAYSHHLLTVADKSTEEAITAVNFLL